MLRNLKLKSGMPSFYGLGVWFFFIVFRPFMFNIRQDIVVDNCAICRNDINEFCMSTSLIFMKILIKINILGIECQANQASTTSEGKIIMHILVLNPY